MPIVTVGPVQLYYEVRGSGPPVLFIMGATGDAGTLRQLSISWPTSSPPSRMTGVGIREARAH